MNQFVIFFGYAGLVALAAICLYWTFTVTRNIAKTRRDKAVSSEAVNREILAALIAIQKSTHISSQSLTGVLNAVSTIGVDVNGTLRDISGRINRAMEVASEHNQKVIDSMFNIASASQTTIGEIWKMVKKIEEFVSGGLSSKLEDISLSIGLSEAERETIIAQLSVITETLKEISAVRLDQEKILELSSAAKVLTESMATITPMAERMSDSAYLIAKSTRDVADQVAVLRSVVYGSSRAEDFPATLDDSERARRANIEHDVANLMHDHGLSRRAAEDRVQDMYVRVPR